MTTSTLTSYCGLQSHTLEAPNNHRPQNLTDKKRHAIKSAFRLAINRSRTHDEAVRLTKLRTKFFSPGGMTEDEAILAWLEVTTSMNTKVRGNGIVGTNAKFRVAAA